MLSMQGRNTLAVTGNSSSVLSAEVVRVIDGDTIEVCCIGLEAGEYPIHRDQ